MLDVRRLRVLCEVARLGSFSAAAESLGYTQPAVSRQIAVLEAETGATLVQRLPQGAVLTDAGRLLVGRATAILSQLDDAEADLQALLGLRGGRLRLASFASAASTIVPLAVLRFRERHPRIELRITMADPDDSFSRVRSGELDLALSHDPAWLQDGFPGLDLVPLFDDPMYVALPLDHPLAQAEPLSLSRFGVEAAWMVGTSSSCPDARLLRRACLDAGFEPRIAMQNDDYGAILGFVAAGVGVALVPDMVTHVVRRDVVIRELEPALPARPISVAAAAGYRSPAASAMIAVLQEIAAEWVAGRDLPVAAAA